MLGLLARRYPCQTVRMIGVENRRWDGFLPPMPMSVEEIVREVRHLPREQAVALFDRLLVETVTTPDPEVEVAWKKEIRRRIAEIETSRETGVDGGEVLAELRQIVGR